MPPQLNTRSTGAELAGIQKSFSSNGFIISWCSALLACSQASSPHVLEAMDIIFSTKEVATVKGDNGVAVRTVVCFDCLLLAYDAKREEVAGFFVGGSTSRNSSSVTSFATLSCCGSTARADEFEVMAAIITDTSAVIMSEKQNKNITVYTLFIAKQA